jgi:hypothetical protein
MEALIECDWNGSSSGYSGQVTAADRNAISASAPRREWVSEWMSERARAGDNAEEAKVRVTAGKIEERWEKSISALVPMSFSGLFYFVPCLCREEVGEQLKIDGLVAVLLRDAVSSWFVMILLLKINASHTNMSESISKASKWNINTTSELPNKFPAQISLASSQTITFRSIAFIPTTKT